MRKNKKILSKKTNKRNQDSISELSHKMDESFKSIKNKYREEIKIVNES
jgi:hypothetical protein